MVQWGALRTSGNGARWQTRSGNTLEPDETWSAWQESTRNDLGELRIASPPARYLQYRVLLSADAANKQPQVSRVEVVYRAKNSAPQVAWTTPAGGEYVRATTKATWQAQDADSDKLRYTLSISNDDGLTFQPIALKDATTPTFDLDTTKFKDGTYRLKAEASDTTANPDDPQSASKISAPFVVDNTAPTLTAQILQAQVLPLDSIVAAQPVTLRATATDATSPISGAEWRFVKPTPTPTPKPKATPKATPKPAATPATSGAVKPDTTSSTRTHQKATTEAAITIVPVTPAVVSPDTASPSDEWNAMAAADGIFDSRREELVARPIDADVVAARKANIAQIEVRVRDSAGNSATTRIELPK